MTAAPPPDAPPPDAPPPAPPPSGSRGGFLPGLGLTVLLHLLQLPLWVLAGLLIFAVQALTSGASGGPAQDSLWLYISIAGGICLLLIGLSQLVYMVPAIVIARRRGRTDLVQGLTIGLAATFLLNAGCWGLLGAAGSFG